MKWKRFIVPKKVEQINDHLYVNVDVAHRSIAHTSRRSIPFCNCAATSDNGSDVHALDWNFAMKNSRLSPYACQAVLFQL